MTPKNANGDGVASNIVSATPTGSETTRVSVDSSGTQGNGRSGSPSTSADGRYVAFYSAASNLVSGDTNDTWDVFVHDRSAGITTRVSVDSSGTEGNDTSRNLSISADGRYVAFQSESSNLVSGDTNALGDIFVHDRTTGIITRVSVDSSGTQGNGRSVSPSTSADGRYVAFYSAASNLVSGDTNDTWDVFVHDRSAGITTRVSVDSSGTEGNDTSYIPSTSADGRYVAFYSAASNLVSGDTNALFDVFVHDRNTGVTTRTSMDSSGAQLNTSSSSPSISADGRYVAFDSGHFILVRDRITGTTTQVGQGQDSNYPSISADGRYVAFESFYEVPGDNNTYSDIFVHDRSTGVTILSSVDSFGTIGDSYSGNSSISADGRYVAFHSESTNLVSGDTNADVDIFVHELLDAPAPP